MSFTTLLSPTLKNIDENDYSTDNIQQLNRDDYFCRMMAMWPRYKVLSKATLSKFTDVKSYKKLKNVLEKQLKQKVIEEKNDEYVVNKLGIIWNPNLQWDYLNHKIDFKWRVIRRHFVENKNKWDSTKRYKHTLSTRLTEFCVDKYRKYIK